MTEIYANDLNIDNLNIDEAFKIKLKNREDLKQSFEAEGKKFKNRKGGSCMDPHNAMHNVIALKGEIVTLNVRIEHLHEKNKKLQADLNYFKSILKTILDEKSKLDFKYLESLLDQVTKNEK